MRIHLKKELDKLNEMLLRLSLKVERNLIRAIRAIEECDDKLAVVVLNSDEDIDNYEIEVEEECLKILALHQPVAIDLRIIVAILKINNDLERIGDLAVGIAKRTFPLKKNCKMKIDIDFSKISEIVKTMLNQALDAFVNLDVKTAEKVLIMDDKVDMLNREMYDFVKDKINQEPDKFNYMIHILSIYRNLERVADHITNIAEDILYMVNGSIVRHKSY